MKSREKTGKKRYSYIRHPFSRYGWICLLLAALAAVLTFISVNESIRTAGDVPVFIAAVGLSALLIDITGMGYVFAALKERDRNHIFTLTGGAVLLAVLVCWICIFAS